MSPQTSTNSFWVRLIKLKLVTFTLAFITLALSSLTTISLFTIPGRVLGIETVETLQIIRVINIAWFTSAAVGSIRTIWNIFLRRSSCHSYSYKKGADDDPGIGKEIPFSLLKSTYTIANRLELTYPFIAAYFWTFYNYIPKDVTFVNFSLMAMILRCFLYGLAPRNEWQNLITMSFYSFIAFLHAYVCYQAKNFFGIAGAFTMILIFQQKCYRGISFHPHVDCRYDILLGMAISACCFSMATLSMNSYLYETIM